MKKIFTIMIAIVVTAFAGTSLSSYAQQKKTGAKRTSTSVQNKRKTQQSKKKIERDTVRYNGEYAFRKEVFFQMGRSVLHRSMVGYVKEFADYVNEHKDCKILIEGFSYEWDIDVKTKEEWIDFQFKISQKRADNVKDMLIKDFSVEADRITTIGRGWRDNIYKEVAFNRLAILYAIP
jgi:outer membrane protein OmpA-like peptidoglycan-associated protein